MSDSDCPIEFGFMVLSVSLTVREPVPSVISAVPATGPSVPEPVPVKTAALAGAAPINRAAVAPMITERGWLRMSACSKNTTVKPQFQVINSNSPDVHYKQGQET